MSDNWKDITLKEVCTLLNGKAYKKAELLESGKYPVLRVGNFFTNRSWYHSDLELDENKYCDEGDLLYAWSASFGLRIWTGPKVIYHYHIWKVVVDEERADKQLLYHWFDWDSDRIRSEQGAGTTMIHVTKGSMEERAISLPPLAEQKRIVSILDEAFSAIAKAKGNAEKNLANARELFESYLNRVFTQQGPGWQEKPLADAGEEIATGPFGSLLHKSDYVSDGTPIVNPVNIDGEQIVPNGNKTITEKKKAELQGYVLRVDDIVIGRRGEMGRCAVVTKQEAGWLCGTGCFIIRPPDNINPYFLCHMLRSNKFRELMGNDSERATMPSISNKQLGELPATIPDRSDSSKFDPQLLRQVSKFQRFFKSGPFTGFRLRGSKASSKKETLVNLETMENSVQLYGRTPTPQRVRIVGSLDGIEASTQRFSLLLDSGERVAGVFPEESSDQLQKLWRSRVLVMGKAVFRASGNLLRYVCDYGEMAP